MGLDGFQRILLGLEAVTELFSTSPSQSAVPRADGEREQVDEDEDEEEEEKENRKRRGGSAENGAGD